MPISLILARPQGRCLIWEGEHLERWNLNVKQFSFRVPWNGFCSLAADVEALCGLGESPCFCEIEDVLKKDLVEPPPPFFWSSLNFSVGFLLLLVSPLVCYGAMSWLQVRRLAFIQLFWGLALAQGLTGKSKN